MGWGAGEGGETRGVDWEREGRRRAHGDDRKSGNGASVLWQAADEGRLAANEREVGAEGVRRQGRSQGR